MFILNSSLQIQILIIIIAFFVLVSLSWLGDLLKLSYGSYEESI